MKLKDKVVIVTGASRGIGRAIAIMAANEGARVVVNYLNSEIEAESLVDELRKNKCEAIKFQADVSVEDEVKNLVKFAVDNYGKVDFLVNNAGKIVRPSDSNADTKSWEETININLKSAWLMTREVVPVMNEGGAIVNITSYVGQLGSQWVLPYGVAKAGVINLTKAYAKELAPRIRVNAVSPGNIDTEMTQSAGEEFINKTKNNTPLKRLGKPEEIAKAVVFLLSDEASFITGVNLDVDGGFLLIN